MRYITIIILLLSVLPLTAQDNLENSFSIELSKKIFPKFTITLEEDFRLRDNFQEIDRFSTTLEISYRVCNHLKAGGAYNLINYNHPSKDWETRHRYYFYLTGSYKLRRFTFSLRERFQSTYRVHVKETAKRANPKLYLRSRLKVEYDIRRSAFEPFASIEWYNTLNNPQGNSMDRLKYINDTFGHEYGDMAICAAARALMQCSSRDAVPARTGGDEFVLIQSYQSDEVSRELVLRIRRTLEAEGKAQKLPFPLSMSIGTVVTDPESALSFADYVKIADSRMYEEKVQKRAARK